MKPVQEFLGSALDAENQVRAYATTVENPSQQPKNKLSQAAEVAGGLMTLSLKDRATLEKAATALRERWLKEKGWSKAVS